MIGQIRQMFVNNKLLCPSDISLLLYTLNSRLDKYVSNGEAGAGLGEKRKSK